MSSLSMSLVSLLPNETPRLPLTATSMHYSHSFAASSPTVSRSSPTPSLRVPRYLRRYTVCSAHNRPTSPLANSFVPDDYNCFRNTQSDDGATTDATSSFAHTTTISHGFSPSPHQFSNWNRRASEPFTVNPGPKIHHCSYSQVPSPSASAIFTSVLSRAHSLVADLSPPCQEPEPTHRLQRKSSNISIRSQSSVSSSSTACSFHTAVDESENGNKTLQLISPRDSPIEEPTSHSWVENSNKNDWSDSSNSGFRSSAFGFASRGGQSSADTVVSPVEEGDGGGPAKEVGAEYDNDEWPVSYLTTITRQELNQFEKENNPQEIQRRFTWGRRERVFLGDNRNESTSPIGSEMARRKSRKLKKKRPESLRADEDLHALDQIFDAHTIPIFTEGQHDDFDPLKDLPSQEGPPMTEVPSHDETIDEAQIGIAISSDDILQSEEHPCDIAVEAPPSNRDDDEWEDMNSSDPHSYTPGQLSSEDDPETWLDDAILRSRTPQEILQGLDVVHEEEEEDSAYEIKREGVNEVPERAPDDLEKRESYPYIKNKGKEREDIGDHEKTIEKRDRRHDEVIEGDTASPTEPTLAPPEDIPIPSLTPENHSSSPRRRKLSKRQRSRRKLDLESLPSTPQLKSKSKSTIKSTSGKGDKRDGRVRTVPTSRKPSVATLRPRRTPKTLMSSVRSHVFRPFTSFALLLGIDVAKGKRRLSRELRTPNILLAGRHFSGKHIPRFPSRLDGIRSADKKVAAYE